MALTGKRKGWAGLGLCLPVKEKLKPKNWTIAKELTYSHGGWLHLVNLDLISS